MASCWHAIGAAARREGSGQAGEIGAVLRRTQRHDPTGDGSAAVVARPEPSHHPAGRVADDVHGRGAGLRSGGAGLPASSAAACWSRSPVPSPGRLTTIAVRPARAVGPRRGTPERGSIRRSPGTSSTGPTTSCGFVRVGAFGPRLSTTAKVAARVAATISPSTPSRSRRRAGASPDHTRPSSARPRRRRVSTRTVSSVLESNDGATQSGASSQL